MPCILIVDDNPSVLEAMDYYLRAQGYAVQLALDGPTGLRLAAAGKVDLIMLDIEMPRMSGFAVCEAIRGDPALRHLPVVVMTGRLTREAAARALAAGASIVLGKPFDLPALKQTLERLLSVPVVQKIDQGQDDGDLDADNDHP